jgi:hypothetical protein
MPNNRQKLVSRNCRLAKSFWGDKLSSVHLCALREITESFRLSVAMGDLHLLSGGWYVTYAGLVRLARRQHCAGIEVHAVAQFCDPPSGRWSFRAIVHKSRDCRGFIGHGDATPDNVSVLVRGAEMRVAETRAISRALRCAYGVGLCSLEELGSTEKAQSNLAGCGKSRLGTLSYKGDSTAANPCPVYLSWLVDARWRAHQVIIDCDGSVSRQLTDSDGSLSHTSAKISSAATRNDVGAIKK